MPAARLLAGELQRFGNAVHGRCARRVVELARAAEKVVGIEIAEHEIGVGDGGERPAMAVAGRARDRAGALRSDLNIPPASTWAIEPPPAPS